MQKESITRVIDNKIIENFANDYKICDERSELHFKMDKFSKKVQSELNITHKEIIELDPETILINRIRHFIIYIQHCNKRMNSMDWMLNNKWKFKGYSNLKIFNLIKLKESLSKENAKAPSLIL